MNSDMKYISQHYVESSNCSTDEGDYTDEMVMMQVILVDTKHAQEHVLSLKGSIKGYRVLSRNRADDHFTLMDHYVTHDSLYANNIHRRFRMRKNVFNHLYHDVYFFDDYFILKKDNVGNIEFFGYQKCTRALRKLAYGRTADSWDEHLQMFQTTCGDATNCHCRGVWTSVPERTYCGRHPKDLSKLGSKMVPRFARIS
ncbi:putative glutathione S-transferase GSTU6 [Hordeum vulgare]|nr:putative glutathione S-transferase GSTU6 [Hordeum vulgare]